jgi:hypothetical protein
MFIRTYICQVNSHRYVHIDIPTSHTYIHTYIHTVLVVKRHLEWSVQCEQLEENHPDGPAVRGEGIFLPQDHLRSGVVGCPSLDMEEEFTPLVV